MKVEDKKENYNVVADYVSIDAKPGSVVSVNGKYDPSLNLIDWQRYVQQKDEDRAKKEELTSSKIGYASRDILSELFSSLFSANKKPQKKTPQQTKQAKQPKMKKFANISRVHFSGDKTIVIWENGDKTIVTCQENDAFDKEKGIAMAIVKYVYGNNSAYNDLISDFIEKDEEKSKKTETKAKEEVKTVEKKVTKKVQSKTTSFVDKLNKKGE